jgi:molybdate transport system substrate-binding protein
MPFLISLLFCLISSAVHADKVRIAVAANFTAPAKELAASFETHTGHQTLLSFGSTGKLFTQITHGAPYHVFLAADAERPELTIKNKLGVDGSSFTYAIGQLALYSQDKNLIAKSSKALLEPGIHKVAIANPKIAPYGSAAIEVMEKLGLYPQLKSKLVRGENIAQTYQFAFTRNAQLGFVARSQVINQPGHFWPIPPELYTPIKQDTVLLTKGADNKAAIAFLDFLKSERAKAIISRYGYRLE